MKDNCIPHSTQFFRTFCSLLSQPIRNDPENRGKRKIIREKVVTALFMESLKLLNCTYRTECKTKALFFLIIVKLIHIYLLVLAQCTLNRPVADRLLIIIHQRFLPKVNAKCFSKKSCFLKIPMLLQATSIPLHIFRLGWKFRKYLSEQLSFQTEVTNTNS